METKFTKEKWEVGASNRSVVNKDKVIVRCCFGENSLGLFKENEAEANALLISKAPEMLEMLKIYLADLNNIIPQSDAQRNRIQDVEQLIKEATEL